MKTIQDVTLSDLMGTDLDVWLSKNKGFGFNLQIDDESGCALIDENNVHPYAAESFADFCRSYLACYDKAAS